MKIWQRIRAFFEHDCWSGKTQKPAFSVSPQPIIISRRDPYQSDELEKRLNSDLHQEDSEVDRFSFGVFNHNIIPPSFDHNVGKVDQSLISRGLLSEEQIREIHEIGDLWIKYYNFETYAHIRSRNEGKIFTKSFCKKSQFDQLHKKQLFAQKRANREAAIAWRKKEDIIFLGSGVSSWLSNHQSNIEALNKNRLPILLNPSEVASTLGISVSTLRWLCFHSEAATRINYCSFEIPKRTGGKRLLSVPHKTLSAVQKWILDNILESLPVEHSAHGFIKGRSTLTNAIPHLQKRIILNLDLKDFFPSINFYRIRGVFYGLGYSPAVSTIFALICSESPRKKMEYEGRTFFVATGPRSLPQGACTSPAISNQVTRRLDRRLQGMAFQSQWTYTRYADDLTFSTNSCENDSLIKTLAKIHHIVKEEGFCIHTKKQRIQRPSGCQMVTGIVVNEKPGMGRNETRRLRAILHKAKVDGLDSQNKDGIPYFEAWLRGKIAYLYMIDPKKGALMLEQLNTISRQEKSKTR